MNSSNDENNLLEIETQNMLTSLELFEIVKQNAEEYCNFVRKYKECTSVYFDKISKITYSIKKDNMLNKNLNISPIFNILNKIPELIKLKIQGLKTFVESLDLTIAPLENVLKQEINSLEEPKRLFEEYKRKYLKNLGRHKKLMDTIGIAEKKTIRYYLSKKKKKDYNEEKNNMVDSLTDAKILETEFLKDIKDGENYHWSFQQECLNNIEQIKSHIRIILENLNSRITFFLCVFNNCYSPCVNFIENEMKNINSNSMNANNLINENMSIKTYKLEELPSDKYVIQIFNKSIIEKLTYSIDITTIQNTSKFNFSNLFNFFIKENNEISEDEILQNLNKIDLLGIAKNLFQNLKLVSRSYYDIKSEEEKIKVKNYSDKLLLMRKNKNSHKKNDIKKLFEFVKKRENGEIFMSRLKKIRSFGNFEYSKKVFDDIHKIFMVILDEVEKNKDAFMLQFSIILSQTFYFLKNGKKEYLYKFTKSHKVYKLKEMWTKMLDSIINEKSEQFNQIE